MTADILTLIAHHATAATEPCGHARCYPWPVCQFRPAVSELDVIRPLRREAQRRFDSSPVWARGLAVAA